MRSLGAPETTPYKPARDVLFTIVDPESKYKAKSAIDTMVYRFGDASSSWLYTFMSTAIGLGFAGISFVGAGFGIIWTIVSIYLGRQYEGHSRIDAKEDGLGEIATKPASA